MIFNCMTKAKKTREKHTKQIMFVYDIFIFPIYSSNYLFALVVLLFGLNAH